MKNTFVISCPIDTYSGYGARSRDVVKALIELDKYDVKVMPQRWGNTPWGFIEENEEWHFLKPYLLPAGQQLTTKPDIWAQITVPNEFQPIGEYNIGITAGIETDVCAPQWIEGMNRMNINFVSSNHSKTVFETSKFEATQKQTGQKVVIQLNKPVEVLFEGADLKTYFEDNSPCLIDFNIKESFAYLFVGHWLPGALGEDRKNVGLLVKAFFETFKNKKNAPALILKTSIQGPSYMDRDEILKRISEIRNTVNSKNLPNIYLLHGNFSDKEMNSLYNHSKIKAMVSLTKGEGFGRPLLEFSLTKKPIIATNWSGHIDFLNGEFTKLLGGNLTPIHKTAQQKDMLIEGSKWFSVNTGEVGNALKDMFENYKSYVDSGKRQAYYSKTNFSFDKMKELLGDLLDKNVPEIAKQVKLELPKLTLPKLEKING
jgi:glycosyltransferase involved in cell wall biosynthesis